MRTNAAIALLLEDEPLISMHLEQTLESAYFDVSTKMSCEEGERLAGDTSTANPSGPEPVLGDDKPDDQSFGPPISRNFAVQLALHGCLG